MELETELQKKKEAVEKIIRAYLPKEEGYQSVIMEAMNYSVLRGGKRLRPILMAETCKMFSGLDILSQDEKIEASVNVSNSVFGRSASQKNEALYSIAGPLERFMAAMEMIHNYSLVHDDLPAMDNDDLRRGKKTTHVVFGEAMGILAGDALLNYAYETAAGSFSTWDDEESTLINLRCAKSLSVLSKKSGIYGMVGGQVCDVNDEGKDIPKGELMFIHENKTAALIEASMMIGAILAGAKDSDVAAIEKIASNIGIAFQIRDDILDVTSTDEELGKPVGSDEKNKKVTFVTFEGVEKSEKEVIDRTNEAIDLMHSLPGQNIFLEQLIFLLAARLK